MDKYNAAIVGYGNIGRFLVDAVGSSGDFRVAGVVRRPESIKDLPVELKDLPVVTSLWQLDQVDVA
ncbi:MAG TPA: diaminopimelate dehydrogenase, partial [Firmicutes bacterium]|nr:diaminopimelate dehydrogenase [Bacillota bacterium]